MVNNPKIIVTVGPATNSRELLYKIKDRGVDFIRVNLSHSSLKELGYFISLAKEVGLPFILDTEGSQVRTGNFGEQPLQIEENEVIKIYGQDRVGKKSGICLKPGQIISKLQIGDLLHIDFHSAILRITDVSTVQDGFVTTKAVTAGVIFKNKAVVIDPVHPTEYRLPVLTRKDYEAIAIGLKEGAKHIAVSFVRRPEDIDLVKKAVKNQMEIISKIECVDALKNLDAIIAKTDWLLIDRGDLSKEIPIEKISLAQDIILKKARKMKKPVVVATNFLETMVEKEQPTRAEIHDIVSTVRCGAFGLVLSQETAIGKYPIEAINRLRKIITHAAASKIDIGYLVNDVPFSIVPPHGGKLVNRILAKQPDQDSLKKLKKLRVDEDRQMDTEQIAIGTFSPLEGFMTRKELNNVLDKMRLPSGVIWTLPIILDADEEEAKNLKVGEDIALTDHQDRIFGILHLKEKYKFDKNRLIKKLYGTDSAEHPGVRMMNSMKPVFLAGKVDLIKKRDTEIKEYELTPRQVRKLFEERGWLRVVGFHTRNVIHKAHEFVQLEALRRGRCDGLLVHPIVGKKKTGDFHAEYIVQSYAKMSKNFYPKNKVVFSVFSSYSRYAGPREAVFTAICRKNYGCSHFIVGRDHAGVGNFYPPTASHDIFDKLPGLGIKIIKFNNVFYSKKLKKHIHTEKDFSFNPEEDQFHISGTQVRKMMLDGKMPPTWFMRPEISKPILTAIQNGREVFVSDKTQGKVVWFTGLSGSGKSTIANGLYEKLTALNKKVLVLDGDAIRKNINRDLEFSRKDIRENNKLIAQLAKSKMGGYDLILIPVISPYREDRKMAKSIIGEGFLEFYVNTPLEICVKRDAKGLYKKAAQGNMPALIGYGKLNPYEPPSAPDLKIQTESLSVNKSVEKVVDFLSAKNII